MRTIFTFRRLLIIVLTVTVLFLLEKNRKSRMAMYAKHGSANIEINNTNTDYILFQSVTKYLYIPFIKN